LGYFGGYNAVITQIDDFNFIYLECSDGSTIVVKRSEIIKGITSGRIKFKSFADNIKPQHWLLLITLSLSIGLALNLILMIKLIFILLWSLGISFKCGL
jgi:hypothetical protein